MNPPIPGSILNESEVRRRHILPKALVIGLAAGLLRTLLTIYPPEDYNYPTVFEFIGLYSVYLTVLIPVCILPWYALACHAKWRWLIATSFITFFAVNAATYLAMRWNLFSYPNDITMLLKLELAGGLSILATTLPLRFCGYRMVRVRKAVV